MIREFFKNFFMQCFRKFKRQTIYSNFSKEIFSPPAIFFFTCRLKNATEIRYIHTYLLRWLTESLNFSLLIRSYSSGENSDDLSSDFYVSISDISISLFPSPRQERKNDAITIEHQKQYDYLISRQSHLPISGFVLNKNIIFIYL